MTALPDIPRLYTALAECLSVLLITPALVPRFSKTVTAGVTLLWAAVLSAFLGLTGNVPGRFWIPCMATAIGFHTYIYGVCGALPCWKPGITAPGRLFWQSLPPAWSGSSTAPLAYPQPVGAAFPVAAGTGVRGAVWGECAIGCTAAPSPPGTYRSAAALP